MDLTQIYDPELLTGLQTFPTESMVNWDDLPAALKRVLSPVSSSSNAPASPSTAPSSKKDKSR